jgi:hypothetical protein
LKYNSFNTSQLIKSGDVQWLPELSKQTVAFLSSANLQGQSVIDWTALNMKDVAIICYGLKDSLEPNRESDYFSDDQLLSLTPALRCITRKLIDHLDDQQLMRPGYQSYGNVIAVLSWLVTGLRLSVPDPKNGETKLLAEASKNKVGIDAIFKQATNYFSKTKFKALDTRQLGKLVYTIGKAVTENLLNLNDAVDEDLTLRDHLSGVMLELSDGNALLKYSEWGEDNFGEQELKFKPINPVAVANLADGLLAFLSHLFYRSDTRVGTRVNRMADFIKRVLDSGSPSRKNLISYSKFLYKASKDEYAGTNLEKIDQILKLVNARISPKSSSY